MISTQFVIKKPWQGPAFNQGCVTVRQMASLHINLTSSYKINDSFHTFLQSTLCLLWILAFWSFVCGGWKGHMMIDLNICIVCLTSEISKHAEIFYGLTIQDTVNAILV